MLGYELWRGLTFTIHACPASQLVATIYALVQHSQFFHAVNLLCFFLTPHAVSLSAFVETLPAHIFSTRCGGDRLFRAAVRAHPLAIDQIGACQAVPPCVNTRASTQRAIRPFQSFICRGRRLGEPTLREAPVELVQRANGPPG